MIAEGFPTLATEEGLLPCVDSLVLDEVGPPDEGLATLVTPVGFLPCVPALVQGEGGALVEGFPTLATHEETLPGTTALTPLPKWRFAVLSGLAIVSPCAHSPVLAYSLPGWENLGVSVRRLSLCRNESSFALRGREGAPEGQSLLGRPVSLPVLLCGALPTAGGLAPPEHILASRQSSHWALPGPPTAWTRAVETGPRQPLRN